jgi:hypothetical protein
VLSRTVCGMGQLWRFPGKLSWSDLFTEPDSVTGIGWEPIRISILWGKKKKARWSPSILFYVWAVPLNQAGTRIGPMQTSTPASFRWGAQGDPEPVWTQWLEEKLLASAAHRTPVVQSAVRRYINWTT